VAISLASFFISFWTSVKKYSKSILLKKLILNRLFIMVFTFYPVFRPAGTRELPEIYFADTLQLWVCFSEQLLYFLLLLFVGYRLYFGYGQSPFVGFIFPSDDVTRDVGVTPATGSTTTRFQGGITGDIKDIASFILNGIFLSRAIITGKSPYLFAEGQVGIFNGLSCFFHSRLSF